MKSAFIMMCFVWIAMVNSGYAIQKDTVYKHGDFLFETSDNMKVDFIVKGPLLKRKTSKGDTLYHDAKYTILGDRDKLTGMGVYKKYRLKHKFSEYQTQVYKGKLALPDFKTDPSAKLYKTQIKNQCKSQGINFAGHYTVIEWGCGTECENIAIVDRISGAIYYSNIPYNINDEGFFGTKYRPDSRMMIMNSFNLDDHKGYELVRDYERTKVMEWTGSGFKKLP